MKIIGLEHGQVFYVKYIFSEGRGGENAALCRYFHVIKTVEIIKISEDKNPLTKIHVFLIEYRSVLRRTAP